MINGKTLKHYYILLFFITRIIFLVFVPVVLTVAATVHIFFVTGAR